ncbi:VacJ family lipoprotein [Dasania sp. GY-MA-18]|uniref:VacJ family lipoprotein n=1 Tax=Dasania phycosphaerae TaxID=2950436 RepID=A0A9J6RNU3_9GAMM|nr:MULTISPECIES: VacJ family lipoprotein [Dasania]MCR8923551.1 VacJ family lipoprotein [Dasania sp. GY-MA-18]MCZ0865985.1 VacJ family lipoprotein [Dasania phycosphaerae]MCZ0869709.1 VacJ family lipoprotein [Dasania phycosphaerae]
MRGLIYSCLISFLTHYSLAANAQALDIENPRDPWEGLNRKVFVFNDNADHYVLAPVARGYRAVTPDPVETGIRNVFSNLLEITTIANDLLQLEFAQAGADTGRFLINSTVGLLGIFDVASKVGLEKHDQDFGLTLASWGLGSGPYVVLPLVGPSTLRDSAGIVVDSASSDYMNELEHVPTRNQVKALQIVNVRAGLLKAEELVSGDRYVFIRDAYLQRRDAAAGVEPQDDGFGDEDFESFDDWD